MKLNIVNPTAASFNDAVGISDARRIELSGLMDEMVKAFANSAVRTCDVWQTIAGLCNNLEEVVYCTIVHCSWHALRGRVLA